MHPSLSFPHDGIDVLADARSPKGRQQVEQIVDTGARSRTSVRVNGELVDVNATDSEILSVFLNSETPIQDLLMLMNLPHLARE